MSHLMKAVGYNPPGLIESLHIAQRALPALRDNECLVKVVYSALNRADTLQRKGLYPPPPGESDILGLEAVGYVYKEANSPNPIWKKNERVMGLVGGGGNAEFVAVNEKNLIRIPDFMSYKDAAAIPEVWLTAFQLLYWVSSITYPNPLKKDIKDAKVLVHAAASGVSTSLIQMLKNVLNIETIYATVGSEEKRKFVENELKVTKAFNYKSPEEEDFSKHILNLTNNQGVDVIFDCIGGSYWQKNVDSLAMDGEWILYGLMGGANVTGDILNKVLRKRIHLKGSTLRTRSIEYKHKLITDFESRILIHFRGEKLKVIIDSVYELDKIADAHRRMESNLNIGKILLKMPDETGHEEL